MCGIFAAINTKSFFNQKDYEEFRESTNVISYRGPDNSGIRIYNTLKKENALPDFFNVFLGHRRLSIIDLSESGSQPMQIDGYQIIFNGEIFNYIELRNELISLGEVFLTPSDTEVILKIYKRFGRAGFAKMNGMWAFAILDMGRGEIVLSRDRFSIKPLYYLYQDGKFYFSSEIKQIHKFSDNGNYNLSNLSTFLRQGIQEHNNGTFFCDIQKVPAKCNFILNIESGKHFIEEYWTYKIEHISNEETAIEQFREIFIDSVRMRLRSDVKIGALLSGGLDSSAITVVANELNNGNFHSYSIISEHKKFSEEKFIDIITEQKKLNNNKLMFDSTMMLKHLDQVIKHQEEPFGSFSVVAQYLIFKKIKDETDIVVVLSGQGGDEILMGYLKYYFFNLQQLKRSGDWGGVFKQLLGAIYQRTILNQFDIGMAKRYIPSMAKSKLNYLRSDVAIENVWSFNTITERQIRDIEKYSVPALAHFEDRNSMAHSLEVRHPFLDHRLVDLMLSIDTNLKIKNGWNKYLLRKSMHELPKEIAWRRDKKGFSTPDLVWLRGSLKEDVYSVFKNSCLADLKIIEPKAFITYYERFLAGDDSIYENILRTYIAEKWLKSSYAS